SRIAELRKIDGRTWREDLMLKPVQGGSHSFRLCQELRGRWSTNVLSGVPFRAKEVKVGKMPMQFEIVEKDLCPGLLGKSIIVVRRRGDPGKARSPEVHAGRLFFQNGCPLTI